LQTLLLLIKPQREISQRATTV